MKRDIFLAFYVYIRKRSVIFASLLKPQHFLLEFRVSQTRVRLKLLRESKSLADTLSSAWVEGRENRRQMTGEFKKTIDIDNILRSKMGAKVKFVPRFLVSWLKRIIHQDEVNRFLWESRGLSGTEWLEECVRYLKMNIEIVGIENLPDKNDGRLYTFVSNHPLGGQDGVALGSIIGRHYDGRFRYLVNDLLLNLPGLKPVCIGINKTGRNGRDFPRMVEAGFKSDNHMLMFPAGLNSRRQKDGSIHDVAVYPEPEDPAQDPVAGTIVIDGVTYTRTS